jgi:hypothetical protein
MEIMLTELLDLFESNGRSANGALTLDLAKLLKPKWQAFVKDHHAEIAAQKKLDLDGAPHDLVPPGWTIHRQGKPDWPK